MRNVLFKMMLVISLVCGVGQAKTLFVNHFDNTTGATAMDRLEADLGVGGTEVTGLTMQDDARPDLVTNQKMFGDGAAVQMAWARGQTLQLLYGAQGNVNPQKGSFECWLYAADYPDRYYSIFHFNDAGNSIQLVNDGADNGNGKGKLEYRIKTAGGTETAYWSANNMYSRNAWIHLAIDWKLDSDTASGNSIRAWINGTKGIDVAGFAKSTMNLTEASQMALFSRTGTPGADLAWLGNADDVRITDTLISELYTLDGNGNLTPPITAWTFCGDPGHAYPIGDLSENCEVDFIDLGMLAEHWLECTAPECD